VGRDEAGPAARRAAVSPAVGTVAPDFRTRNQHGETLTRAGVLEHVPADGRLLLVFYPWAFSGICTGELAALREGHDRLAAAGVRLLAVSCDAMFTLRAFAEAQDLPFDLLTDHWPHGAIARTYGVFDDQAGCALRGSFLLDRDGRVTWSVRNGIGEPRDILAHLDASDPARR
jgi:peroxiredoxin